MEIKSTKKTNEEIFIKGIIYGKSSVGKTTLCSTLDKCIVLSAENGLLSLKEFNIPYIEIKNTTDLMEAYEFLYNNSDYDSIVVDSISEIAQQILTQEKLNTKDLRQQYMFMQDKVIKLLKAFRDIPNKNVILLAQESLENIDNKLMYNISFPGKNLHKDCLYLFDFIFRMVVFTNEEGILERFIQTVVDEESVCKDRSSSLESFEEPNLNNIFNKIKGI